MQNKIASCKIELRVASCKLRVANLRKRDCELQNKIASWKKFASCKIKSRVASYELEL